MLAAYFCHSCQSQVEYNCSLKKVDWLAACIALRVLYLALYLLFSSGVGVQFAQSASQWDQGMRPEEIYQTLLTNKKETWVKYTTLTLLSRRKLALTARNTLFAL
jgi:hypothetical protein